MLNQIKHKFKNPLCYNCDEAIGKPEWGFLFKRLKNEKNGKEA